VKGTLRRDRLADIREMFTMNEDDECSNSNAGRVNGTFEQHLLSAVLARGTFSQCVAWPTLALLLSSRYLFYRLRLGTVELR
jgi:hypothetical protein